MSAKIVSKLLFAEFRMNASTAYGSVLSICPLARPNLRAQSGTWTYLHQTSLEPTGGRIVGSFVRWWELLLSVGAFLVRGAHRES